MLTFLSQPDDVSVETVEQLRLTYFRNMLHKLGFKTVLNWRSTQYTLAIKRGLWPFLRTIQTVSREITSSKPMVKCEWPTTDYTIMSAISSLYKGALEQALDQLHISLAINETMQYAVNNFNPYLAYGLHVFPIQYCKIDGQDIFWVVRANSLGKKDHKFTRFTWPDIDVRPVGLEKYPDIRRYLNLFLERYFGVRTLQGEIITNCAP